jgi:plasmid stabilization system protein ParE
MKVRYTRRASHDLEAILHYLSKHSPQGLRNVRRAMANTERFIGQFPQGGRLSKETGTHVLPAGRYPYLIYWIIDGEEAKIVHIRDGRRKPWRGQ